MEPTTVNHTTTPTSASMVGPLIPYIQSRLINSWTNQLQTETTDQLQRSRQVQGLSVLDQNQSMRPVYGGHYVWVEPTGLPQPRLVLYSPAVAQDLLQLSTTQIQSMEFLNWVSGNVVITARTPTTTTGGDDKNDICSPSSSAGWATPYALSIMGQRYTSNCPFGTGDGYGDGRAISIAEIQGTGCSATGDEQKDEDHNVCSWELQLKGAGKTPFHRGADGRAVYRSSIREFLASEAMHALGVPTTRALSLVVSQSETVLRPWYSDAVAIQVPTLDDPRLAQYNAEQRQAILQQVRQQKADPDRMVSEPAAITCRVARSFVRVGHVDLFARRALREQQQQQQAQKKDEALSSSSTTVAWQQLVDMIWHACYRDYRAVAYDPYIGSNDIESAARVLLHQSAIRIATMVAHWIRVGFAQGNFNADNCLISGATMDYGPFGFIEEYHPLFAKWTGSGPHFGFLNQPSAGLANYQVLVESIAPVIVAAEAAKRRQRQDEGVGSDDTKEDKERTTTKMIVDEFMEPATAIFQAMVDETMRHKLGFFSSSITTCSSSAAEGNDNDNDKGANHEAEDAVWSSLEPLMRRSRVDWTVFFRQLTHILKKYPDWNCTDYVGMVRILEGDDDDDSSNINDGTKTTTKEHSIRSAFYEPLSAGSATEWQAWIQQWREALALHYQKHEQDHATSANSIHERMLRINPKFVLREWMLVKAYRQALAGDEHELHALFDLIQHPYEEGTEAEHNAYYRRAPDEALTTGGTAFMSCSS